ncbi:MAG: N-acetylmuramoyl-L-alanine amidase, partial [Myxococcota bacterium]
PRDFPAESSAWSLDFSPTPLVRRIAFPRSGTCSAGSHYRFTSDRPEMTIAVQIAPATEGRLRLGALRSERLEESVPVYVDLERRPPRRRRPPGMKLCGRAPAPVERLRRVRASPTPRDCKLGRYHVMLDPGHGPEKQGAMSAGGRPEFEFNDALADETEEALRRRGRLRVSRTRDAGEDLGLAARVARVNRTKPDLLVSLHHDSTSKRRRKNVSVGEQTLSSCTEHYGFSVYLDTLRETGPASYHLARRISDRLLAAGIPIGRFFYWGQLERGIYNGDMLYLLRRSKVPAVLIESGFICNHDEERRLSGEAYRKGLARLIADAVVTTLVETRCQAPKPLDASGLLYPPFGQ